MNALKRVIDELHEEDGFTPELIEMVDLDVAYSPVIMYRGEGLDQAAEVLPTVGDEKFIVRHPLFGEQMVYRESLRVMRLRYLLAFKEQQRRRFEQFLAR